MGNAAKHDAHSHCLQHKTVAHAFVVSYWKRAVHTSSGTMCCETYVKTLIAIGLVAVAVNSKTFKEIHRYLKRKNECTPVPRDAREYCWKAAVPGSYHPQSCAPCTFSCLQARKRIVYIFMDSVIFLSIANVATRKSYETGSIRMNEVLLYNRKWRTVSFFELHLKISTLVCKCDVTSFIWAVAVK